MLVTRRHLTGPLVRLTLEGQGLSLISLVPLSAAAAPGSEAGVSLDPDFTFTFASSGF
jgi:hypothetical protein